MSQVTTYIEHYRQDLSVQATARLLGVPVTEVYQCMSGGGESHRKPYSPMTYPKLIKLLGMRAKGVKAVEVQQKLNVSARTITKYCDRYGLSKVKFEDNREERMWEAVVAAKDYKDFRENYQTAYGYACRFDLLDQVKEKFK